MSEVKPTPIIKPTIGRRVWFRCNDSFAKEKGIYRIDDVQAMDAGIVYVHGDTMVNLIVTDHIGNTHAINSVSIVDEANANSYAMWCEWMPYQKEQVKKHGAEQQIEQEIQSKNLNAPRLTPADIDAVIVSEHYFTAAQGEAKALEDGAFVNGSLNGAALRPIPELLSQITFCVLILKNGYKISGVNHSGVSPENHDPELGRKLAYEDARNKVWELEGYLLKEKLNHQIKIQEHFARQGVDAGKLQDSPIVSELPELEIKYSDAVKSTDPTNENQACSRGSVGECIHRTKLLNNRENAYLLTQLLSLPNINKDLRKKAETKMDALLDQLI